MSHASTASLKDTFMVEALLIDKGTCPERMLLIQGEDRGGDDMTVGRIWGAEP
jgi:hypothetical protein